MSDLTSRGTLASPEATKDSGDSPATVVHDAALLAARAHHSRGLVPFDDRYELAWEAAAVAFAGGERSQNALISAGLGGITAEVNALRKHHGLPDAGTRTGAKFGIYWRGGERLQVSPFEDWIVERLAVCQVYWALSARDQEILLAEAWDLDHGYTVQSWRSVLMGARKRARRLWFNPESTPAHYAPRKTPTRQARHDREYRRRLNERRADD